jgi:hypothetical protein
MQVRQTSILMPGAFFSEDSAFVSVYYKNSSYFTGGYAYCILVEKSESFCKYDLTQSVIKRAGGNLVDISQPFATYQEFPVFEKKLIKENYKEVFTAEIHKNDLENILLKSSVSNRIENIFWTYSLDTYPPISTDNTLSYRSVFESGLQQLQLGRCPDDGEINLAVSNNNGLLGEGCILAIAQALESGSCQHFKNLTINLGEHYYLSEKAKSTLQQACESPLSPLNAKFQVAFSDYNALLQPAITGKNKDASLPLKEDKKDQNLALTLINYVMLFQFNKQQEKQQELFLPWDILLYIMSRMLDLGNVANAFSRTNYLPSLFNKHHDVIRTHLAIETICAAISNQVCNNLNFKFTFRENWWLMISDKLSNKIRSEVKDMVKSVLQELPPVQSAIFLRNGINWEKFASTLAGQLKKSGSFDAVITGRGCEAYGLTKIFFSDINTADVKVEFSFRAFGLGLIYDEPGDNLDKNKQQKILRSVSSDELNGSKQERKNKFKLLVNCALANEATSEQLQALIDNSEKASYPSEYKVHLATLEYNQNENANKNIKRMGR